MGETKQVEASNQVILKQDGSNYAAWSRKLLAKLAMKIKQGYTLSNFVEEPYAKEPNKDMKKTVSSASSGTAIEELSVVTEINVRE